MAAGRRPRKGGFTLLELLVVALILALAVTAIGACLAGGMRVWDAARRFGAVESRGILALHAIARDLRNTFPHAGIGFEGLPERLTFPALVRLQGTENPGLGSIELDWDRSAGLLTRRLRRRDAAREETDILAEAVLDLRFGYYFKGSPGGAGAMAGQGQTTNMPDLVEIVLTVDAGEGQAQPLRMSRWVPLTGGEGQP